MKKKEEILEAAYKHFSRKGYNVSMADIAKEIGIKPPSLYSHFISKDEIVYLIVEKEIVKYYEFLNKIYDESKDISIEEKFKNIFFSIVKYFKDNDKLRFWKNALLISNEDLRKKCSELLCYGSLSNVDEFISKIWMAYWNGVLNNIKCK